MQGVRRSLPHSHREDVVALFEKAFHPPAEKRLFGYRALEIVLELLLCALLDVTPSISNALGSALVFTMAKLVVYLHIDHLLSQLAVLVILVFRLVAREFFVLLNPVIRFSTMSQGFWCINLLSLGSYRFSRNSSFVQAFVPFGKSFCFFGVILCHSVRARKRNLMSISRS